MKAYFATSSNGAICWGTSRLLARRVLMERPDRKDLVLAMRTVAASNPGFSNA